MAVTDTHPPSSARLKLGRAEHHRDTLSKAVDEFRARDAYEFPYRLRSTPFSTRNVLVEHYVEVNEQPPADEWSLILGDVLTNLRAALDHSVYRHVVSRTTLTDAQVRHVQMPICVTEKQWADWMKKPIAKQWVSPAYRDAIEQIQPVRQPDVPDPCLSPLYALNELVNMDKHRMCHVLNYSGQATLDRVNEPLDDTFMATVNGKVLAPGKVVASRAVPRPARGSGDEVGFEWDGEIGYTETVEVPGIGRLSLLGLCNGMIHEVDRALTLLSEAE